MSKIEVRTGKFKNAKEDEILFTRGLAGCAGLALVKQTSRSLVRRLAHVHYSDYETDEEEEMEKAQILLENCVNDFLVNSFACISYVPCTPTNKGYTNKMAEFIIEFIESNRIPILKVDNARRYARLASIIDFKDMIVHQDKVLALYKRYGGVWMNCSQDESTVLEF